MALLLGCGGDLSEPPQTLSDTGGDGVMAPDASGGRGEGPTLRPATYELPSFDVGEVAFPYCAVDEAQIDSLMEALGRRGQIGQHLMFGVNGSGDSVDTLALEMLEELRPGGVFLGPPLGIAVGDPARTAAIVGAAQAASLSHTEVPLFVALDQEGGANSVVNSITGGTDTLGGLPTGATLSAELAFDQFDVMGRELMTLGFNMALAPVLDTLTSTRNGNLNTRSFGPDPALNAILGVAAMAGFQRHGVLAVGKHFPGDGLSSDNPHTTFVTVEAPRALLEETLFVPFEAAITAGIDGMMTMPARFSALDDERSAIISRKVTHDLLRQDLGFGGLVVTDALGMEGASFGVPDGQSPALTALQAGADVLLEVVLPMEEAQALVAEIEGALDSGLLSADEFEVSTRRILAMKQRYCLFERVTPDAGVPESLDVGRGEDAARIGGYAHQAVVLLHDTGVLPLAGQRALYVGPDTLFQDPGSTWLNVVDQTFADAMRRHDPEVLDVLWTLAPNPSSLREEAESMIALHHPDVLVVGTLQGRFSLEQQQLVAWLMAVTGLPVVHVVLGVPFDYLQTRDHVAAALAVMGSRSVMVEAAADVLYGVRAAEGHMLYELLGDADSISGAQLSEPGPDRCVSEGIVCGGGGVCVDTGVDYGCVCHPNWHAAHDGLTCIADGQ
ncbi:MAG: glycoside hydrolase family 3 protein [Myxococcota bacterium]